MKKIPVRICGLLLTAVMLAGLLPAFSASAVSLEEKQRAVVLTAFAYYDKGAPVQYDSTDLSVVTKKLRGPLRITHECAPEYATEDETLYSVCSDFTYQVYYDAFRFRVCDDAYRNCTARMSLFDLGKAPICVYQYNTETDDTPRKKALAQYLSLLQPGDIVNSVKQRGGKGHAMLCVGDCLGDGRKYLLHCDGAKYDIKTGADEVEGPPAGQGDVPGKIHYRPHPDRNGGGIKLSDAEKYFLDHYKSKRRLLSIIRPLAVITDAEYPMTDAAKGRLQFPRLVYNRTASPCTRFTDVEAGGTVTLKIELKNCSGAAYTVPVKEVVPEGAVFVKASDGATVSGKEITWNVALGAGETKTVSYDCAVTASRGEKIVFEGGSAGSIPSNSIRVPVGGKHLTDAENAALAELVSGAHAELFRDAAKDDVPKIVWQKILKLNVPLPTAGELFRNLLQETTFEKKRIYLPREDLQGDARIIREMLVPELAGGLRHGELDSLHRVLDLKCKYLLPGDVVYALQSTKAPSLGQTLVYLGDGNFLRLNGVTGEIVIADRFALQKAHTYQLFFVLRPTLAYDDVHTIR